eukprot:411096-Amorphochlora_amoeboformis.AAC.1
MFNLNILISQALIENGARLLTRSVCTGRFRGVCVAFDGAERWKDDRRREEEIDKAICHGVGDILGFIGIFATGRRISRVFPEGGG